MALFPSPTPHPKKKSSQITEQYQEETIYNIFNEAHVSP